MNKAEVIIIGGGLAGLTAAIHLARHHISTVLFEKEEFPRHKVCGEYLSNEILPYLNWLEIPLMELQPNPISQLLFSSSTGHGMEADLPLGGMGVSRFALDDLFYRIALQYGVKVIQEKVSSVEFRSDRFLVYAGDKEYESKHVLGAFGKRSSLDKYLKRPFFKRAAPWLAVKAHYTNSSFPSGLVALHNFKGGYCGLSRTETKAINLCYLATYESFKKHRDPEEFQVKVLQENPFLKEFFSHSTPIFDHPISIAQVSFEQKSCVENHVLLLGDAAGLLHPLCGNGMAMAIHSGKLASELLLKVAKREISREEMENTYHKCWNLNFKKRMQTGRRLQSILLNPRLTTFSQHLISLFPSVLPRIIKHTHGQPIL